MQLGKNNLSSLHFRKKKKKKKIRWGFAPTQQERKKYLEFRSERISLSIQIRQETSDKIMLKGKKK